jgi:hypothetical protein
MSQPMLAILFPKQTEHLATMVSLAPSVTNVSVETVWELQFNAMITMIVQPTAALNPLAFVFTMEQPCISPLAMQILTCVRWVMLVIIKETASLER